MVIVQFTFSFRSGHTTSVPSLTDDINNFIHMVFSLTPLLDINNNYIYRLEVNFSIGTYQFTTKSIRCTLIQYHHHNILIHLYNKRPLGYNRRLDKMNIPVNTFSLKLKPSVIT